MNPVNAWRPVATPAALRSRAAMLATARKFFADRDILEVETPLLASSAVTDPHIQSIALRVQDSKLWLRTSPEYHMKRLLAANPQDIYQIGKVFRDGESGLQHQPEFTMIEWYRLDFGMPEMINETCELIRRLSQHGKLHLSAHKTVSYADAFQQACGLNPLTATLDEIRSTAQSMLKDILDEQLLRNIGDDRAGWLDLLVSHIVNPSLGNDVLHVITDYPAEQALLARLHPDNEAIAERFEVFFNGIELANGYCELRDASEQARRFQKDNERRKALGLSHVAADDALLAALESGLPVCTGVAVGLDRLQMLAHGHDTIAATLSFLPGS